MGAAEIEAFLTYLAVDRNVAASTQNQALSALIFFYRQVLKQDLAGSIDSVRAKRPKRLPTVLTKEETLRVFGFLSGTHSATPSPPTCSKMAMTSAPSRNCSAIRT